MEPDPRLRHGPGIWGAILFGVVVTVDELRREDLWEILAELYLDSPVDHEFIAIRLASTPVSIAELETILFREVHPALYQNLLVIAGRWDGWNRDWLIRHIQSQIDRNKSQSLFNYFRKLGQRVSAKIVEPTIRREWDIIQRLIVEKRSSNTPFLI